MSNPSRKSRTFRLWVTCYFFMLLIPLSFSLILYYNNVSVLTAKARESGMVAVRQLSSVMDEQLKSVYRISDSISIQQDIISLKDYELPFNARKYYDIHTKLKSLSVFGTHQDLISSIYIYHQNMHCLLDAGHIYTKENQYDRVIERSVGMDTASFEALMNQGHLRDLVFSADGTKCLLLQTIATDYKQKTYPVTLVLVLNTTTIHNLLEETSAAYQGHAVMTLENGSIFSSRNLDIYQEEDMVACVYPSDVATLQYKLLLPKQGLFRDVDNSRGYFFYFIICTLVCGSALAYVFARHNYKPLSRITQDISPEGDRQDDFVLIGNRLRELKEHCDQMQNEVNRLGAIENSQTFAALLDGDLSMLDQAQRTHLNDLFAGDMFVCALICDDATLSSAGRRERAQILGQTFDELVSDACQCMVRYHGSRLCAVFCFDHGTNHYDAQLFVKHAAQRLLDNHQAQQAAQPMSIYVGDAQEHMEGISLSLQNATRAKEYTEFVAEDEHQVVLYDHMMYSTTPTWKDCDIADAERRFASLMITRNYTASQQLIKDIMAYYAGCDGLSLYQMRCRMFGLMNMMLNVLREVETDLNTAFRTEDKPLEKLMTVRTMQELEDVATQIIDQLAEHQQSGESGLGSKLEQVIRYIEANYSDPNLSVQMIAEEFSLSLPYLSREFKRYKETGVLSYINECRIRHAKKLMMENSNMTVAEVAQLVGYNSSQTLIRIFKRYEGVTPGSYRSSNGE